MGAPVVVPGICVITLSSSFPYSIFIQDLGLHLNPGQTVDLGAFYTQKQILDSQELKRRVIETAITVATSGGTTPSIEPVV